MYTYINERDLPNEPNTYHHFVEDMKSFRLVPVFVLTLFIFTISHTLPVEHQTEDDFPETTNNEIKHFEQHPNLNRVQDHRVLEDEKHYLSETDHVLRQKRAQNWFNGKTDTNSGSARAAFRKAKDQNGIPRSKKPVQQYYVPDKHDPKKNLRQYDYINSYGEKISIRKDMPIKFADGGYQGPHYNAGPTGGKLKQHHHFPSRQG
ncbi:unnamed protein product [Rotaria socialis]|uniref:Uncharacterized protein n=2 Tax=Rotaria socialis TaxID=392032 RepID=A0A817X3F9_9BILA|nr:unnamed protein product [Rotaria socialis]